MPEVQSPGQLSIDEILESLAVFDGKYKRAEVDAAIANREEITPKLIEVLEGVLANPEKIAEDETYIGHVYALMLLGHFREPRAHRTLIALSRLGGDLPYRLFGDSITEDLAIILLRTCNGSIEAIKGLVQDKGADDYCRGAGARAITYGVIEGIVPREEALSFLGGLLEASDAEVPGVFYDMIASCLQRLCPEELMDKIEAAYAEGLIDPGYIDLEDFRQALSRGKEKCLLDLRAEMEERSLDDIHGSMSWWACFDERDEPVEVRPVEGKVPKGKSKRVKSKIAAASRKKNRKKKR
ncbi:MAG: DUF1186 domain-containing protein [Syntrophaceae bacterium]|nr:DUF1186 domain-containing protein [Syntrophaceae bacterium]